MGGVTHFRSQIFYHFYTEKILLREIEERETGRKRGAMGEGRREGGRERIKGGKGREGV